jgi:cellulase/cellobiase CelA1
MLPCHPVALKTAAMPGGQCCCKATKRFEMPAGGGLTSYRDCAALASNGELKISELVRYKTQYIDAIANAITAKPAYKALRIVAVVEPDSL